MRFSYGETVTLVRRVVSGRDVYGDDVYSETRTTLSRVPAYPTSSTEEDQGRATVSDSVTILLPPNTNIDAIDAVEVFGDKFEVTGQPQRFISPFTGENPGLLVVLRRVTG